MSVSSKEYHSTLTKEDVIFEMRGCEIHDQRTPSHLRMMGEKKR